jgi:hypothetical protein
MLKENVLKKVKEINQNYCSLTDSLYYYMLLSLPILPVSRVMNFLMRASLVALLQSSI